VALPGPGRARLVSPLIDDQPPLLTRRELEVLAHAAQGRTAAATAGKLGLGEETVKTYRCKILRRLRARNMTEAVAIAYQRGLLP
jgi:DNA-binding NarL/FixJ family response regulator